MGYRAYLLLFMHNSRISFQLNPVGAEQAFRVHISGTPSGHGWYRIAIDFLTRERIQQTFFGRFFSKSGA
ncbi:hypothetical protein L2A60_04770 [Acidiphilium iwatense]|uniref:Uncharacterized protein n=2 Tax=Acidiphilium iwatense TaxID=768198 RepID=A0ABS9DTH8_9PROT|nr:hypothetical protein [Acidiphilium iwatense]